MDTNFLAIENWCKNVVQLASFVAHLTVLNKPLIHTKLMSHLWPTAAISVFELFHVINVGLTFRTTLSARKRGT